ncbi:MAG: HEAT repeat domain-containing protein [Verrucomicrobiales bacterium]|nr:HEAT repeat domain-containing protein [Verrucomicrobiales bacterium]
MNARARRRSLIVGAILVAVACAVWALSLPEPRYQGRSVSSWFGEYASVSPSRGKVVEWSSLAEIGVGPGMGGYPGRTLANIDTGRRLPDPALDAFRALGPRAVPSLVRRLRPGLGESKTFARLLVRLPPTLRDLAPNPWESTRRRAQAVEILASLGPEAFDAVPSLVSMMESQPPFQAGNVPRFSGIPGKFPFPGFYLYPNSASQTAPIAAAIVSILKDPDAQARLIRDLAQRHHYRSAVELIDVGGWRGPEAPKILGDALADADPVVRQKALRILEGVPAPPSAVTAQILTALQDPDGEVRWLAARTLESTTTNDSPAVIAGLQAATRDTNIMVQTVATRALSRLLPKPAQAP